MSRTQSPERRMQFLEAALKLFVARGVKDTSTAEIAREAGTAAGTLFLYFPTKQDLINELTLLIARQQAERIKSLIDPAMGARETFLTIWESSITWFFENLPAYNYIQQVRDSGIIGEAVVMETNTYFDFYYLAIQKGLDEGVVKTYPVELIGGFLYQDIVAVMNLLKVQPQAEQRANLIRQGFQIFWDGICQA